jgi:hypothetical protein
METLSGASTYLAMRSEVYPALRKNNMEEPETNFGQHCNRLYALCFASLHF